MALCEVAGMGPVAVTRHIQTDRLIPAPFLSFAADQSIPQERTVRAAADISELKFSRRAIVTSTEPQLPW